MDNIDLWLARASAVVALAVAVSKETRSWYVATREQNKKAKNAPKFGRQGKR